MDIRDIASTLLTPEGASKTPSRTRGGPGFRSQLLGNAKPQARSSAPAEPLPSMPPLDRIAFASRSQPQAQAVAPSAKAASGAYEKQLPEAGPPGFSSDVAKYKDDQLLSNPGGDHYDLDRKRMVDDPSEQTSFWGRVGKDLKDAFSNVKNFVGNLLFGSQMHYRDENGQIQETRQRGLVGSVVDFFQDLGSALSFGAYRPDGEDAPEGFKERVGFFFSKLKEAVFGDLVQGVAGSVVHMAEDLLFAGWNLVETVPDATIGHFEAGRKATTAVFDNGQVVLDYLTDIIPGGEASIRVHSPDLENLKAPVWNNLSMPERHTGDVRWKFVRNTPFRKAIETVGSIAFDILSLKFLGDLHVFGEERHRPD